MSRRLAFIVAIVAIAGAIALDQRVPASPSVPSETPRSFVAGSLACPAATLSGAPGSISVANVGEGRADVRVSWYPRKGKAEAVAFALASGATKQLRPKGASRSGSSAALVEFSGSEVIASHTVASRGRGAASACLPSGPTVLAVGGLSTLRARSILAVFNPGTALVEVGVVLFAGGRRLSFQGLRRIEVPARSRVDIALDDFVFDTERITAVVRSTTSGRVVVEGIVNTDLGLTIVGAVEPAEAVVASWLPRASGASKQSYVSVAAVGSSGSAISGRVLQAERQGRVRGLPPELRPGASAVVRAPGSEPLAAFAFEGTSLVSVSRWAVGPPGAPEDAAVEATPPVSRWGAVIGIPNLPARIGLIVSNPGPDFAPVVVQILGGKSVSLGLAPGTVRRLALAQGKPVVAVTVRSESPVGVAMEASFVSARAFNIAVPGLPLDHPAPAPVRSDPRAGIPVRIRDIDG